MLKYDKLKLFSTTDVPLNFVYLSSKPRQLFSEMHIHAGRVSRLWINNIVAKFLAGLWKNDKIILGLFRPHQ